MRKVGAGTRGPVAGGRGCCCPRVPGALPHPRRHLGHAVSRSSSRPAPPASSSPSQPRSPSRSASWTRPRAPGALVRAAPNGLCVRPAGGVSARPAVAGTGFSRRPPLLPTPGPPRTPSRWRVSEAPFPGCQAERRPVKDGQVPAGPQSPDSNQVVMKHGLGAPCFPQITASRAALGHFL